MSLEAAFVKGPTTIVDKPCGEPLMTISKLGPISWTLPLLFSSTTYINQTLESTMGCFDVSSPYFSTKLVSYVSYNKTIIFQYHNN